MLILFLLLFPGLLLRILVLDTALSHDEAIWGYIAKKLLDGNKLFADIIITTPPLILIPYLLGEILIRLGMPSLRFLGLVWNILTISIIFQLARYLFGVRVAVYTLVISFLYTLAYSQGGHFLLQAEHLSQLPLFLSILLLLSALKKHSFKHYFFSGLLMGILLNIRESYLLLYGIMLIYLLIGIYLRKVYWRGFLTYILGSLLLVVIILAYFFFDGNLTNLIQLTIINRIYYFKDTLQLDPTPWLTYGYRITNLLPAFLLSFLSLIAYKRLHKDWFRILVIYLLPLFAVFALILIGKRLHNYYFLYLNYSLILPTALGLDVIVKMAKKTSILPYRVAISILIIFYFFHYIIDFNYLSYFNKNMVYKDDPWRHTFYNQDLLNVLNAQNPSSRILLLGYSSTLYYYLNSNYTERIPASDEIYRFYKYGNNLWQQWFSDFQAQPAKLIVVHELYPEGVQSIPEFSQFMKDNYRLVEKIRQYYIFQLI